MSINPKIIRKINEKKVDTNVKKLLIELLNIESDDIGWYKDKYNKTLEKYIKEGDALEN